MYDNNFYDYNIFYDNQYYNYDNFNNYNNYNNYNVNYDNYNSNINMNDDLYAYNTGLNNYTYYNTGHISPLGTTSNSHFGVNNGDWHISTPIPGLGKKEGFDNGYSHHDYLNDW